MNADGIGMCHNCFSSNVQVRNYDGDVLCGNCYGKKFPKKNFINIPEPTIENLKRKFEREWHEN